jgi:hypothetical protein
MAGIRNGTLQDHPWIANRLSPTEGASRNDE